MELCRHCKAKGNCVGDKDMIQVQRLLEGGHVVRAYYTISIARDKIEPDCPNYQTILDVKTRIEKILDG